MINKINTSPGKILVIDDQHVNLKIIESFLSHTSFEVITATTGKEALEIIDQIKDLDIVLLDLVLPDIDGIEVCRQIRLTHPINELPVLIVTGSDDDEAVSKAFEAGGSSFIVKPVKKSELIARLNTHLKLRKTALSLKKSNAELAIRNQEKDKLFSILAHDLRSPIAGISGMMDILIDDSIEIPPDELKEIHGQLNVATLNLLNKLEDLLGWARWRMDSTGFEFESMESDLLVHEVESKLTKAIAQKECQIEKKIEIDRFVSHRESLYNLLVQLLSNAIRFSPRGSTLKLRIFTEGSSLVIEVIDQGSGMSPAIQKDLREGKTVKGSYGTEGDQGTGIGLIWVRDIVSFLEGSINFENLQEGGCKVTCQFPLEAQST